MLLSEKHIFHGKYSVLSKLRLQQLTVSISILDALWVSVHITGGK